MARSPSHTESVRQDLFVEPLGGPIGPDGLLDSFPDSLYDKSPSSHFYRFLFAILGPAGVGGLVRSYFETRLKFLEYGIEYHNIERFYGDPFNFGRILEEQTEPTDRSLLPDGWEKVKAQDASYRSRALDFLAAVRLGGSPQGVRMAAKSGLGHDVDLYERYRYIFDQNSDQPIGVKNWGHTCSTSEFTIVPRQEISVSEIQRIKFEATTADGEFILVFKGHATTVLGIDVDAIDVQTALRNLPVIGSNGVRVTGGPVPLPFDVKFTGNLAYEDVPEIEVRSTLNDGDMDQPRSVNVDVETLTEGVRPLDEAYRIPDRLAHNMQDAVDRLRPVNSLPTVNEAKGSTISREWRSSEATSHYQEVVRFVTGRLDVNWPEVTEGNDYWIEKGVEKPALRMANNDTSHYVHFHRPASVIAYSEDAISAPSYNTAAPDEENYFAKDRAPIYAVDANPDSRKVLGGRVQGLYPIRYSELSGTTPLTSGDEYWESVERLGPTADVLEIDLGTNQVVNFLSFDVGQRPISVEIDYDAGEREFVPIVPTQSGFTGYIDEGDGWSHLSTGFTDRRGQMIITKRIRLTLQRRTPIQGLVAHTVSVRGFKAGRSVV
jgi:hypothetical protein